MYVSDYRRSPNSALRIQPQIGVEQSINAVVGSSLLWSIPTRLRGDLADNRVLSNNFELVLL